MQHQIRQQGDRATLSVTKKNTALGLQRRQVRQRQQLRQCDNAAEMRRLPELRHTAVSVL